MVRITPGSGSGPKNTSESGKPAKSGAARGFLDSLRTRAVADSRGSGLTTNDLRSPASFNHASLIAEAARPAPRAVAPTTADERGGPSGVDRASESGWVPGNSLMGADPPSLPAVTLAEGDLSDLTQALDAYELGDYRHVLSPVRAGDVPVSASIQIGRASCRERV